MDTPDVLRIILVAVIAILALLAINYLRHRKMRWYAYLGWGLLAFLVPVAGPILVLTLSPGQPRPAIKNSTPH